MAATFHIPDALLRAALREDCPRGDVTGTACVPAATRATAHLVAKGAGVVAGLAVAARVFRVQDRRLSVRLHARDGRHVAAGTCLLTVQGPARAILAAERTALNLLGHASGIATRTAAYVRGLRGTRCRILDTRKTTPLWRALDRLAVRAGGGHNHRRDLSDQPLIKTNHLQLAGGAARLPALVAACRRRARGRAVVVEVRDVAEFDLALAAGADVIMVDNAPDATVRRCLARRRGRTPLVEVSGGITPDRVARLARMGVDRISVGALTHSAPALDVSLRIFPVPAHARTAGRPGKVR